MSYIVAIETAVPGFKHAQDAIIRFYQNSVDDETIRRKIKAVGVKSGIHTRYSVIGDYSNDPSEFQFFPKNKQLEPVPGTSQRMALFKQHACALSIQAIRKIPGFEGMKSTISHIITVTCTGLSAPGLDIELVKELQLDPGISRSSVNFMGCNAALLALKNADAICRSSSRAKVLIICTELSTIHFQKNYEEDYLLSTALFGDGCACILVSAEQPRVSELPRVKIDAFHSALLHSGNNHMAWRISDTGFIINLSSYVSELINGNIKKMMEQASVKPSEISHWAIHPGGKKILDDFKRALGLSDADLRASYDVLSNYGNMSSATVLFVLKAVIENAVETKGKIFTAAFGPGLSVETMLLQRV